MGEATLLDLNKAMLVLSFHLADKANKLAHVRKWESPYMKPAWKAICKRRAGELVDYIAVMAVYVHGPVDISHKCDGFLGGAMNHFW